MSACMSCTCFYNSFGICQQPTLSFALHVFLRTFILSLSLSSDDCLVIILDITRYLFCFLLTLLPPLTRWDCFFQSYDVLFALPPVFCSSYLLFLLNELLLFPILLVFLKSFLFSVAICINDSGGRPLPSKGRPLPPEGRGSHYNRTSLQPGTCQPLSNGTSAY